MIKNYMENFMYVITNQLLHNSKHKCIDVEMKFRRWAFWSYFTNGKKRHLNIALIWGTRRKIRARSSPIDLVEKRGM